MLENAKCKHKQGETDNAGLAEFAKTQVNKKMTKAENRFQEEKHKKRAKKLIKDVWHEPELANDEKFVGIEAGVHSRRCSCPMCKRGRKNPWAKSDKLTMQERRENEACLEDEE